MSKSIETVTYPFGRQTLAILLSCLLCLSLNTLYAEDEADADSSDLARKHIKIYPVKEGVSLTTGIKFKYGKPRIVMKLVAPKLMSDTDDDQEEIQSFNEAVDGLLETASQNYTQSLAANVDPKQPRKKTVNNNLYTDFDTSIIKSGKEHIISIRMVMQGFFCRLSQEVS